MSEERYVSLAEVKEMMQEEAASRELTQEQKLALDQSSKMARTDAETAKKLMKELSSIDFITEGVAVKIADLMPTHADDIRVLFAKERIVLDKKQIEQIIKSVEKYL
jgi:DNA-directed RNA polymerase subunit F